MTAEISDRELCQPPGVGRASTNDQLDARFKILDGLSPEELRLILIYMLAADPDATCGPFEQALRNRSRSRAESRVRDSELWQGSSL